MRFGSVCSGIEAASVAWHSIGWEAAWLAEVDVSASAVLAHRLGATAPRFPMEGTEKSLKRIQWGDRIVNWGDMTRLPEAVRTGAAEAPDILCGGTPCQGFSIAGLRGGLSDPRGQLTLSFVELANAIDDRRAARGQQPCVVFWENVPGVRSDSGNAFGHFLAALVGVEYPVEPGPRPEQGRSSAHWTWKKETSEHVAKWPSAGAVAGPRRTVGWRSSDAQYFGLAQRRERVFLVASAREGFDPQVVLLEFDGLRRDSAPSRDAGESVAGTSDEGAYRGSHWDNPANPHPSLNQSFNTGGIGQSNQELFSQRGAYLVGSGLDGAAELVGALDTECGFNKATMQSVYAGHQVAGAADLAPQWWDGSPISQTLDAVLHKGQTMPEKNRFPAVLQPVIPILEAGARTGNSTTDPRAGIGIGSDGDPMFTLQSSKQHAVAVLPFNTTQITSPENGSNPQWGDPCFSLAAGNHPPAVAISVALRGREGGGTAELGDEVAGTLRASGGGGDKPHVLAFSSKDYGNDETADLAPTMRAMNHSGSHVNGGGQLAVCVTGDITHTLKAEGFDGSEDGTGRGQPIIASTEMAVRRLMPEECESLQGFPKNWTLVPVGKGMAADGPRYKQVGNSWAVPCVTWIGRRLDRHLAELDGIIIDAVPVQTDAMVIWMCAA
jgi:DNA (cytosine-5)-methyltransferase 1